MAIRITIRIRIQGSWVQKFLKDYLFTTAKNKTRKSSAAVWPLRVLSSYFLNSGGGTGVQGGTIAPGRRRKGGAAPGYGAIFWGDYVAML